MPQCPYSVAGFAIRSLPPHKQYKKDAHEAVAAELAATIKARQEQADRLRYDARLKANVLQELQKEQTEVEAELQRHAQLKQKAMRREVLQYKLADLNHKTSIFDEEVGFGDASTVTTACLRPLLLL